MRTVKPLPIAAYALLFAAGAIAQPTEYDIIPFLKANGRWTYADAKTRKPVMKRDFEMASLFVGGTAIVRDFKKSGVIDRKGEFVIPLKYNDNIYRHSGRFITESNAAGKKADQHTAYELFPGGREKLITYFYREQPEIRTPHNADRKYGYVDRNGKVVIPPTFDFADGFSGNFATVAVKGMLGLIDTNGRIVVNPQYLELRYDPRIRLAYAKNQQKLVGFVDSTGRTVVDFKYRQADYHFKGDYIVVEDEDERHGVVDLNGRVVVPLQYAACFPVLNRRAVVRHKEGKYGMVDFQGRTLLPFEYDFIWDSEGDAPIMASKGGKAGLLDRDFKTLLPFRYESIGSADTDAYPVGTKDTLIVRLDGKYGVIDISGKALIPLEWDGLKAFDFKRGLFEVKRGEKVGLYNLRNEAVVPVKYRQIDSYVDGWLLAMNEFQETVYTDPAGFEFVED